MDLCSHFDKFEEDWTRFDSRYRISREGLYISSLTEKQIHANLFQRRGLGNFLNDLNVDISFRIFKKY